MSSSDKFKALISLSVIILLTVIISSCKTDTQIVGTSGGSTDSTNQSTQKSVISGQVINKLTGIPIDSAIVVLSGNQITDRTVTDSQGKYSFTVTLSSSASFYIYTSKTGYYKDTTYVGVSLGVNSNVSSIKLSQINSGSVPSGDPVSIFLASQSADVIGVKESGSQETASLVFEIRDSSGTPIDLSHSVTVNFTMGTSPGGGEFLSPASVKSNTSGKAQVNLTSGTKAGVVQIIATINLKTGTIVSRPVSITIHGGLPDAAHFSIAPAKVNFPGFNISGLTDAITAFVGDKYGNPVRSSTSVYFTTSGGIIEGSALTNSQGIGSVSLISADPRPTSANPGVGFATVTASTANDNLQTISTNTVVLFSGLPQVSISPTSFNIANGGSQSFTYTVSDQNANPLAQGTSITVSVQGENITSQGDLNISLPDTQSKSWTHFSFTVADAADTINVVKPVTITINTTGLNGGGKISISGTSR